MFWQTNHKIWFVLGSCFFLRSDPFKKHLSRSVISIHSGWVEAHQFSRKSRPTFLALWLPQSRQAFWKATSFSSMFLRNDKMNIFDAFPHLIGEPHQQQFLSFKEQVWPRRRIYRFKAREFLAKGHQRILKYWDGTTSKNLLSLWSLPLPVHKRQNVWQHLVVLELQLCLLTLNKLTSF